MFPLVTVTGNSTVSTVAVSVLLFSSVYCIVLVVVFIFQMIQGWSKKGGQNSR